MINNDWDEMLEDEFKEPYFRALTEKVKEEYKQHVCYPPINQVFNALRLTSYRDTKVLILGQDPYHNPNQAMGLAFSVKPGIMIPASLQNIFLELSEDLHCDVPKSGDLTHWGNQGVLLLNAILTVRQNQPLAHQKLGWAIFTDKIITLLNQKDVPMVFVLWGSSARSKTQLITNPIHLVIENVHPSPLSANRGFFGSRPFSTINRFLESTHQSPIDFTFPPEVQS